MFFIFSFYSGLQGFSELKLYIARFSKALNCKMYFIERSIHAFNKFLLNASHCWALGI